MQYPTTLHLNLLIPWCLDFLWFASNSLIKIPASIKGLRDLYGGAATTLTSSSDLRTSVVKANRDASARTLPFFLSRFAARSLYLPHLLFLLSERETKCRVLILHSLRGQQFSLTFLSFFLPFLCVCSVQRPSLLSKHITANAHSATYSQ